MRIGIDGCCWSNRRGFGRFTRELVSSLVAIEAGHEYILFVDQQTAHNCKFPAEASIVTAATRVAPTLAASANGRRSLRDLWTLTRSVLNRQIDVFFFPAVYSFYPILGSTKVVVTIHDLIADRFPELVFASRRQKVFWKLKQNLALRQADALLTVSEYSKQQIVDYFHLESSRVSVIGEAPSPVFHQRPPDGVDAGVLSKYSLSGSDRFFLYVGGISPHKNLKTLVQGFGEIVREAATSDVKLVLVGDYEGDPFHSDYDALSSEIARLGLGERVQFTGFVIDEELASLYAAAQALVLPSFDEGFGLPAVEAMACGLPVLASERGSLPEVLAGAGRYFDPLKPEALAAELRRLLSDKSIREQMKSAGLERIGLFTWERAARDTLTLLEATVRANKR
jgi:glycosyltransferase involved in cell wall biosynthesis